MSAGAAKYYQDIARGIDPADVNMWEKEVAAAETMRMTDRAVMDIIGARKDVPTGPAEVPQPTIGRGNVFHWIQLAIELEEQQWVYADSDCALVVDVLPESISRTRHGV
jgi:hypothetical protein